MRNIKIGVEIEFFGVPYGTVVTELRAKGIDVGYVGYTHEVMSGWKIVTDSSVNGRGTCTNNGSGLEIVSPILYGDEGMDELKIVMDTLDSIGARIDKTCGVHIHHDVQDYTLENMRSLYYMYYNWSLAIDTILPASRRGNANRFCNSLSKSDMKELADARSISTMHYIIASRYVTLNCRSYIKYGTIEFRQHSGTVNFDKIEAWIVLTHCMVNHCKHNKVELSFRRSSEIAELIKILNLDGSFTGDFLLERKQELCA